MTPFTGEASRGKREEFELANKAFDVMTLEQREAVLSEMSRMRHRAIGRQSVTDRFSRAVHLVVKALMAKAITGERD